MTTFTPPSASVTRRVAVGLSAGALGADGVPELAATAYAALLAAAWTDSTDAPSMPVHDNGQVSNKEIPSGDAFKCGYGYDASARTERAAAGAVCYSFQLPSAMVAETDAAAVTGLTVRVIGDRYLDAGARVFVALTGSAQPPALAEMLGAEAASAVVCATSGQTAADGETPLAPNKRSGVRADAEITPATPLAAPEGATAAYLHVCLALVDYTTTRGAWIEGGAMLAPDTLRVTFDREVEVAPANVASFYAFTDYSTATPMNRRLDFSMVWASTGVSSTVGNSLIAAARHGVLQRMTAYWTDATHADSGWVNGTNVDAGITAFISSGTLHMNCLTQIYAMAYPGIAGLKMSFSWASGFANNGAGRILAFARNAPDDFLNPVDPEVLRGADSSFIGSTVVSCTLGEGGSVNLVFSGNAPGGFVQIVVAIDGDVSSGDPSIAVQATLPPLVSTPQ